MKKNVLVTAIASVALLTTTGLAVNTTFNSQPVQAAKQKYIKKFYKVRITKRTPYYKVIRGKDEAHNKYKKVGYLKSGKIVYVRARGVVWGWTIGKKYDHCVMRDSTDYSWFTTNLKKKTKSKTKKTTKKSTKKTTKKVVKHPKLTAKSSTPSTKSTTVDTSVLSKADLDFLNDPSIALVAKMKKALSLSGEQRKAADYILMKQEGLISNSTNEPDISYNRFEKSMNNMSNKVQ